MLKKYILTNEAMEFDGTTLYRIKALRDFGDVHAGDVDGRIYGNARVYGNAYVETTHVYGNAEVYDGANVYGNAYIGGDDEIYE